MVDKNAEGASRAAKAFRSQLVQTDFKRAMTTRYGLIATGLDFAKLLERLDAAENLQLKLLHL